MGTGRIVAEACIVSSPEGADVIPVGTVGRIAGFCDVEMDTYLGPVLGEDTIAACSGKKEWSMGAVIMRLKLMVSFPASDAVRDRDFTLAAGWKWKRALKHLSWRQNRSRGLPRPPAFVSGFYVFVEEETRFPIQFCTGILCASVRRCRLGREKDEECGKGLEYGSEIGVGVTGRTGETDGTGGELACTMAWRRLETRNTRGAQCGGGSWGKFNVQEEERVARHHSVTQETSTGIVETKGRVACEISSGDELLLTELIFNGTFNTLAPENCAALLSCFVFDEKSEKQTKLGEGLAAPLRIMQELAKRFAEISIESKLPMDEEKYVASFKDAVVQWCGGALFSDICKLTDDIFEGSVIRVFRRLGELLRQMAMAAKVIGNTELQEKFEKTSEMLERSNSVIFCSSLYL
ncbi:hypothetical protein GYMLUDRAFT_241127 [Collybiopsis luxurians FD-317 M1]|uniref:ATP-dependent RNA helicase Ski2/MTR4 C-terminal domain-containing protein n=1 Tax=Collybiopsis luxurians FD-317 M1 TaxID=944289 RepID=A0A0D0D3N6_9AGAR|nr:hypothetical protein GYMLUDRAFT_241127 [Collybiopsis luxurians FD-317 M1]